MVMTQSINGAGDTFIPILINLFGYWLIEIPVAYFLALHTGLHEKGVYIAIVVAESMVAIAGFIYIQWGRWKDKKV